MKSAAHSDVLYSSLERVLALQLGNYKGTPLMIYFSQDGFSPDYYLFVTFSVDTPLYYSLGTYMAIMHKIWPKFDHIFT